MFQLFLTKDAKIIIDIVAKIRIILQRFWMDIVSFSINLCQKSTLWQCLLLFLLFFYKCNPFITCNYIFLRLTHFCNKCLQHIIDSFCLLTYQSECKKSANIMWVVQKLSLGCFIESYKHRSNLKPYSYIEIKEW